MSNSTPCFLRFVLLRPDPDTGAQAGAFCGAYELQSGTTLAPDDRHNLDALLKWFRKELAVPNSFNRTSSKGYYRRSTKGVSWFKPDATAHIAKMRDMKKLLDAYGYFVEERLTRRPGYVVYEDEHQIVAEPFAQGR